MKDYYRGYLGKQVKGLDEKTYSKCKYNMFYFLYTLLNKLIFKCDTVINVVNKYIFKQKCLFFNGYHLSVTKLNGLLPNFLFNYH